mmetsp:Transcript_79611/g.140503  ORF Transcript_79611/g.140503 Transcript_79611/m.140503 type:complete len:126 (+) Transcript_79611:3709-4086(+)
MKHAFDRSDLNEVKAQAKAFAPPQPTPTPPNQFQPHTPQPFPSLVLLQKPSYLPIQTDERDSHLAPPFDTNPSPRSPTQFRPAPVSCWSVPLTFLPYCHPMRPSATAPVQWHCGLGCQPTPHPAS